MSNPFAMPDSQAMPSTELRSTVRLKRVGVLSAGTISGVGGAVGGLLAGGIFFLMSLTMMGVAQQGNMNNGNDPTAAVLGMGVGAIIFMPIAYGIFGFIGGVIYAFIYNLLAGMTGGLQMEFSRD
jgi:ABC-type antimicrobial peptide transport system permease subunit